MKQYEHVLRMKEYKISKTILNMVLERNCTEEDLDKHGNYIKQKKRNMG
jgi:hypothetical protein